MARRRGVTHSDRRSRSAIARPAARELTKSLLERAKLEQLAPADLQTLATFAAGPRGEEVLEVLESRAAALDPVGVPGSQADPRAQAILDRSLDEAVRVLRAARLDVRLESFVQRILRVRTAGAWPPAPARRPTPLRLFERRFEP